MGDAKVVEEIVFSARVALPILDPLGVHFGSLLASKMAETNPFGRLMMALEGSPLFFLAPRGLQEATTTTISPCEQKVN